MTPITFAHYAALVSPADALAGVLRPGCRPVKPAPRRWLLFPLIFHQQGEPMSTYLDQLTRRLADLSAISAIHGAENTVSFTSQGQVWQLVGDPDNDCIHLLQADGGEKLSWSWTQYVALPVDVLLIDLLPALGLASLTSVLQIADGLLGQRRGEQRSAQPLWR